MPRKDREKRIRRPEGSVDRAFGDVLRRLRTDRQLSQEALAHMAGYHRNLVGMIERGDRGVSLDAVFRLGEALDIRPSVLVARVERLKPRTSPSRSRD